MNTSRPIRSFRHPMARELAPHVEDTWAEAFVFELRMSGVSGSRIGDALTEVESHCAESGAPAADAFGDPATYATSLQLPSGGQPRGSLSPTLVQLAGMALVVRSCVGVFRGQPTVVTIGDGLTVVLIAAELAALVLTGGRFLALATRHPLASWVVVVANLMVIVTLTARFTREVDRLPSTWGTGFGVAVLIAGLVWGLMRARSPRPATDPIIPPPIGEPAARAETTARRRVTVPILLIWVIPAATALMVMLEWWLNGA